MAITIPNELSERSESSRSGGVDFHRHCQQTICSAYGDSGNGLSWHEINDLTAEDVAGLPSNWKNLFTENRNNITQDLASILKIINQTSGSLLEQITQLGEQINSNTEAIDQINNKILTINNNIEIINSSLEQININTEAIDQINSEIDNINNEIDSINTDIDDIKSSIELIRGNLGLIDEDVRCYIAPDINYFQSKPDVFKECTDEDGRTYFSVIDADGYLVPHADQKTLSEYIAPKSTYGTSDSFLFTNKIYPGDDNNLESQYENYGKANQKKYPVFQLSTATTFLKRFRANGSISFIIQPQFGIYAYGNGSQGKLQHIDASGGSTLIINPNMRTYQRMDLPAYKNTALLWTKPDPKTIYYQKVDSFEEIGSEVGNDEIIDYPAENLVKVVFRWKAWNPNAPLLYSGWREPIRFGTNVVIDGCGFELVENIDELDEDSVKGLRNGTYNLASGYIAMESNSHIIVSHCFFKNMLFQSKTDENVNLEFRSREMEAYPADSRKYGNDNNRIVLTDKDRMTYSYVYNMDNYEKLHLPCLFTKTQFMFHMSPQEGETPVTRKRVLGGSYIGLGSRFSLNFYSSPYIVFHVLEKSSCISMGESNSLQVSSKWQNLSKVVFVHMLDDSAEGVSPITIGVGSSSVIGINAEPPGLSPNNSGWANQVRFEVRFPYPSQNIADLNGSNTWLETPSLMMSPETRTKTTTTTIQGTTITYQNGNAIFNGLGSYIDYAKPGLAYKIIGGLNGVAEKKYKNSSHNSWDEVEL